MTKILSGLRILIGVAGGMALTFLCLAMGLKAGLTQSKLVSALVLGNSFSAFVPLALQLRDGSKFGN